MPDETAPTRREPAACSRVRLMLAVAARTAVRDASGLPPDLASVDALARAQLDALRAGRSTVLCGASDELVELLRFAGLVDVLRVETVVAPIRRPAGRGNG
ncbi:hypothetical protein [Cellulomonas cellasea]|uniref:STAS domain-containing protein n=1 Tax=Cellulomonas cellasea TaxID=43670 RepID=A0A7W4UCV8_9CELL|nr:hypothetical protein [Cellulomonas cellasea]MBB2921752.1 hypothetical protein [Cellulomonas cellasea]